jgi:hypothetical protein
MNLTKELKAGWIKRWLTAVIKDELRADRQFGKAVADIDDMAGHLTGKLTQLSPEDDKGVERAFNAMHRMATAELKRQRKQLK